MPCDRLSTVRDEALKILGLVVANIPELICCTLHAIVGWLILEDKKHSEYAIIIVL